MSKDVFNTVIDVSLEGKPNIYARESMYEFLKMFSGHRVHLKIYKQRSPKSNKYFWACCKIIGDELGYAKDEVCEIMLTHFFSEEFVNEKTGSVFRKHPRLSELSQGQQSELTDKMKMLAASEFNIVLPEANQQLNAF